MKFFLHNSSFAKKLICLLLRKGKKEKIENKVLKVFQKISFFIFLENIFFFKLPFKLFPKKFRSGRHSFIYRNSFIMLKKEKQYLKALSYFYLNFKFDSKKQIISLESFLEEFLQKFVIEKQLNAIIFRFKKKKEALFLKSLKHYRWD